MMGLYPWFIVLLIGLDDTTKPSRTTDMLVYEYKNVKHYIMIYTDSTASAFSKSTSKQRLQSSRTCYISFPLHQYGLQVYVSPTISKKTTLL